MKEKWETKLDEAEQRRKQLQDEIIVNNCTEKIEKFKRHWIFKDETHKKNITIFQLYQEEQRKNLLVNMSIFLIFEA